MDPFQNFQIGETGVKVTLAGLGGGQLGELDPDLSDNIAVATIRKALEIGIRYMDLAPLYGTGRSELRFREALKYVPRENYVVSTKVGLLLKGSNDIDFTNTTLHNLPNLSAFFDFSRDAILKSLEESQLRLGLQQVDILYLHNVPEEHYQVAIREAIPTLVDLRSKGVVKAIGAGMGTGHLNLLIRLIKEVDLDCVLLAGPYTLLDQSALLEFLPLCIDKGIKVVIGAPYMSGALFSRGITDKKVKRHLRSLQEVCINNQVPIKAAALQFVAAHPAVVSVIPGSRSIHEVENNVAMFKHPIPSVFWDELRQKGLLNSKAPVIMEPEPTLKRSINNDTTITD